MKPPKTDKAKRERARIELAAIEGEIHFWRIGESRFAHDEHLKLIEYIRERAVEGQAALMD